MPSSVDITALLICEDVRKEVTNKEIIIGVFSGDLVIGTFPNWINASMWMEGFVKEAGTHQLKFRLSLTGKPPIEFGATVTSDKATSMSIPILGVQLQIEEPCDLIIEQFQDETWKMLKKKSIIQGPVTLPFPPLLSSKPSDV